MIDLHLHTNVSDGQYSPTETVRLAKDKGAVCISVTDHDRISGLKEARAAAMEAGVEFIPGIDIGSGMEALSGAEMEDILVNLRSRGEKL